MHSWTLVDTHPVRGRTFQRPLDLIELWFLWLGRFNGSADCIQYCEVRPLNGSRDIHLFSEANIVKAWLSTKRRYPITGATVRGADGASLRFKGATDSNADNGSELISEPHFVVQERDFVSLRPHEVVFGTVASAEEVHRQAATMLNGPRPISDELSVRLYVFRETDPQRLDILHMMILGTHCVTDRVGAITFMRCLLDTLARGEDLEPIQLPLEDRLAMTIPSSDLDPDHLRSLSPAIRRWRNAAGIVIYYLRMETRRGGHTLPCRLTHSTPYIPARSGLVSTSLTRTQTTAVIANCRLHGITFGNAYIALAQVAMTRVLYRRYLRGEISEEEWEYRKRQPCIGGGPLNLRPHLDKTWFKNGGGGESMLSLGHFFYQLPFMTLGVTMKQNRHTLLNGAPQLSNLLSFDRFLHRTGLVKKQLTTFSDHPLFLEIERAAVLEATKHTQLCTLNWMKHVETAESSSSYRNSDEEVLAVTDMPMVWAFAGSTVGSLDFISPTEYPLPPTHPLSPSSSVTHPFKAGYATPPSFSVSASADKITPTVAAKFGIYIHARPGELYITADSLGGQMSMKALYDSNVYEEGVVTEWLAEVREAVLWYLGQTHRPRRAQQSLDGGEGRTGSKEVIQVKL